MRLATIGVGLALAVALVGCSADVGTETGMYAVRCQPGAMCDCPGGMVAGQQACDATGGYMACDCASAATPPGPGAGRGGDTGAVAPGGPGMSATANPMPATAQPDPGQAGMMTDPAPSPFPQGINPTGPPPGSMTPTQGGVPDETPDEMPDETPDEMPDETPDETPAQMGDGTEVPATEYCGTAADWDPAWSEFEQRVLELTNENRAAGAVCGGQSMQPVEPLTMNAELRCAARLHSKDMSDLMYFSHTSADGREFNERISATGYGGGSIGENIAQGQSTPEQVVQGWMDSPGHCQNIMRGSFSEIGIGFYDGAADSGGRGFGRARPLYWTQNFGAPRGGGFGGFF